MSNFPAARWTRAVFSMELRRLIAYRGTFWIQFLGGITIRLTLAYFLWNSIFTAGTQSAIGGYSLYGMILYYLLAGAIQRIYDGEEFGALSQEIYNGGFSRYLVYPVSFLTYRWSVVFAQGVAQLQQLVATLLVFAMLFPYPPEVRVSAATIGFGLVALGLGAYLSFCLLSLTEMLAFWFESVWTFIVMLRFTVSVLGGGLLPLSLFPEGAQAVLNFLPFKYLFSFPVRCFMGEVGLAEWLPACLILLAWIALFRGLAALVMEKGRYNYTGVGI